MNLILRAGDPLTYRRTLFSANASVEAPPSGASWTKLVCIPAPTVTGNGASCARSRAADPSATHARSADVNRRRLAAELSEKDVFNIGPFESPRDSGRCDESVRSDGA